MVEIEAEAEAGPEPGFVPDPVQVAAGIAEQAAVDTGSIVDKPAGMDHSQDTVGNIADTVADTTVQVLAQQLQAWIGVQDLLLLADWDSEQKTVQ